MVNPFFSNTRYSKKLLKAFTSLFFIFSVIAILILFHREKNKNIEIIGSKLSVYNQVIINVIILNGIIEKNQFSKLDSINKAFFDTELRITIIQENGKVLYDTYIEDYNIMEDHSSRDEIIKARNNGVGTDIRFSESTDLEYFYFAKKIGAYYVRTALPVTARLNDILKVDYIFMIFLLMIFFIMSFILLYISDHYGRSLQLLRKFSVAMATEDDISEDIEFSKSELGEISKQIRKIYLNSRSAQKKLKVEKDKLIQHLSVAKEGIGIFSSRSELIFSNSNFISFMDFLSEGDFKNDFQNFNKCKNINDFASCLKKYFSEGNEVIITSRKIQTKIRKNQRVFEFHFLLFEDNNFEIIINDITEPENQKMIKQQITSNISHELKTPVSVISGFMETILINKDMEQIKMLEYVEKSFKQTKRLNTLIDDISVLNTIDESKILYPKKEIYLDILINDIISEMDVNLKNKNMTISISHIENSKLIGNEHLLEAIFWNLIDNSIKYAGQGTHIKIEKYFEDENYLHFKYSDNGNGIPSEHLPRIFERFYRIDKGRSRALGGTGLGLSIVKNSVSFHNGDIFVNSLKNGIVFTFSLKKQT